MKTVYICSPYRGTTEEVARNVALAKRLCRKAALEGNLVLCPHLLYPRFLRDEIEAEREIGITSSLKLLERVRELVAAKGYVVSNIDVTVLAQKPKLAPYLSRMEQTLSRVLGLEPDQINIKATTEEHLGFTGREEGIACHAVCLLEQVPA